MGERIVAILEVQASRVTAATACSLALRDIHRVLLVSYSVWAMALFHEAGDGAKFDFRESRAPSSG